MGKHFAFRAFREKLWISLFLLVASLIAISIITISVFLLQKLHDTMQQDFEERGLILAREFSQRIAEELLIEDTIHLKKQLSQLFVKDELLYAVLYEGKGQRFLHKSILKDDDQSFFLKGLKPVSKTRRLHIGAETKIKTLDICVPVHYEKDIIGWLQLGISLERIDTEVKKRIINLSLFVIGLILFGLLASFIFARSLTKPIKKLLIGVNRIGQGDLSYKVDLQRVDEIGALASAINNMSNELQQKTTSIDKLNQVIKEREEAEDHLRQSQKMEVIGTLAGGVAHDLNNILGGLVSYPELLLLQLPENSPLRKSIITIQKSGEKAAAVVQDLLTLARRGVIVTDVVNLNDVISEHLESPEHKRLQSYYPGVHLETRFDQNILNILGSSTHLSKTVMNLVSNAAEAMPEGGKLTVSTENLYIDRPIRGYDDVEEGDYVVLTISDTGTGISPDDMEKIFEPFYTKKKMGRSGTGLGMAVVWGTIKDHNGYIDVQSTEGKGTTFRLYLPVTREKLPENKSHLAIEAYTGKGESILIVDDVEDQRKIASGMLKELGYSVVSVSSGEEAVEYLKTNTVDLLVLDMIMDPGMDGLDTYKNILKLHPRQKAIIASGFSETDRVKEVQSLGAETYIRKPFLLEKIGLAVKEELEK